jgi:hypothetical protein
MPGDFDGLRDDAADLRLLSDECVQKDGGAGEDGQGPEKGGAGCTKLSGARGSSPAATIQVEQQF